MDLYVYVIVRYVHNLSRGEFVNLGIIMWLPSEKRFIFQFTQDTERASRFFDGLTPHDLYQTIKGIERRCQEAQARLEKYGAFPNHAAAPSHLSEITAHVLGDGDAHIIRSATRAGSVDNPDQWVVSLCQELCS